MVQLEKGFEPKKIAAGLDVSNSMWTRKSRILKQLYTALRTKHTTLLTRFVTELIFLRRFSLIQGVAYSRVGPWTKTWILKRGVGTPELSGPLVYVMDLALTRHVQLTVVRSYASRERRTTASGLKSLVVNLLVDHIH
jgi:hypothetical protein